VSWLDVAIAGGRTAFEPGDEVAGTAAWELPAAPERLDLRLIWYTRGKGTQDVGVVASQELPAAISGRQEFRFTLPAGPYSFSGKLISLVWAVEMVAEPGGEAARADVAVSPTGREILLGPATEEPPPATG
jgi:hypothetical protein